MLNALLILLATSLPLDTPDLVREQRGALELHSDLEKESRDEVAALVGQTVRATEQLLTGLSLRRKNRQSLVLRVFAQEADFQDLRRRTRDRNTYVVDTLSFLNDAGDEIGCAWQAGSERARGQLRRQVARHVLRQFAGDPPIWFEEGLAGYFEGLRLDRFGDVVDPVNADRLTDVRKALAASAVCPLFELMDLQHIEFYGLAGARNSPWPRATLYAQSWAFLFFLLHSEDAATLRFRRLVAGRLATGRWDQSRYRKLLVELEPLWIEFIEEGGFEARGELLRQGWEYLEEGQTFAARMTAARVLERDEGSRSARRLLAWGAFRDEEYDIAIRQFERLVEDRYDDLDALLGSAYSAIAWARLEQGPERARQALEAGRRASERAPDGHRHEGLLIAADAAELMDDPKQALRQVREILRLKGVPEEVRSEVREREQRLIKQSIGR